MTKRRLLSKKSRERLFVLELTKLSRRYGLAISGCGRCGSPLLEDANVSDPRAGYGEGSSGQLEWIDPADDYSFKLFGSTIVREGV